MFWRITSCPPMCMTSCPPCSYRASELTKLYNAAHGTELSSQRISAILRQMKLDGVVTKSEEKRVSYFSLA